MQIEELTKEKGRYAVTVPNDGIDWVHDNFRPTEFVSLFISEIKKSGNTLEDMAKLFYRFSSDVDVRKSKDQEWAICFNDESIDPYVYHIEQNAFGLEYHRFTRVAYRDLNK